LIDLELWAFGHWLQTRHGIYFRLKQVDEPIPPCEDPHCQYKDLESNGMLLKSTPPVILIYLGGPDPLLSLAHEVAHLRLGIENGPDLEREATADLEEYQNRKKKGSGV